MEDKEQKLFDILVKYYEEKAEVESSIKETLADVKEEGVVDKDDVSAINEAAKLFVTNKFTDKEDKFIRLKEKYTTLSGEG